VTLTAVAGDLFREILLDLVHERGVYPLLRRRSSTPEAEHDCTPAPTATPTARNIGNEMTLIVAEPSTMNTDTSTSRSETPQRIAAEQIRHRPSSPAREVQRHLMLPVRSGRLLATPSFWTSLFWRSPTSTPLPTSWRQPPAPSSVVTRSPLLAHREFARAVLQTLDARQVHEIELSPNVAAPRPGPSLPELGD
jgi:hypothetical protein